MKPHLLAAQLCLAIGLGSLSGPALAAPITIDNPSFEDQILGAGDFLSGNPTGWSGYSNASGYGISNPLASSLEGKQGANVAFLNVAASATFTKLSQTLTYIVQENDILQLSFLIGKTTENALPSGEGPFPGFQNYDAGLTPVNGDPLVPFAASSPALIDGEMVLWTRTYQFLPGDPLIGLPIGVLAYASGSGVGGGQVTYDAFSLQTVPEPSVALLAGAGLLGLAGRNWLRRRLNRQA